MENKIFAPLIILFGSRASGNIHRHSDLDIAVLADHPLSLHEKEQYILRYAREFSVSEDVVDVIDIYNASFLLKFEIARAGKLLSGDTFSFVRFQVRAWKEYQDTAKLRRMRVRTLEKALYVKSSNTPGIS